MEEGFIPRGQLGVATWVRDKGVGLTLKIKVSEKGGNNVEYHQSGLQFHRCHKYFYCKSTPLWNSKMITHTAA